MWPSSRIPVQIGLADLFSVLSPKKGSLILILGGSAVLAISLALALVSSRSPLHRRGRPTPTVGPRPKRSASPPEQASRANRGLQGETRLDLHETLVKTAARAGVGTPHVVTDNPGPHALLLVQRLACRANGEASTCDWKREELEQALRQFEPNGHVIHVSRHLDEQMPCIFEIRRGGLR